MLYVRLGNGHSDIFIGVIGDILERHSSLLGRDQKPSYSCILRRGNNRVQPPCAYLKLPEGGFFWGELKKKSAQTLKPLLFCNWGQEDF